MPGTSRRTRAVLLTELVELFLAEGFAEFSLASLADRLHCSKTTLYTVAASKEQIVIAAVREFFKQAAERIEARVTETGDPAARLEQYLRAVSDELKPATSHFYADLLAFEPASEVYRANTLLAARRVQDLVDEGVAGGVLRPVHAGFVGAAVTQIMTGIQRGQIGAATGLDDAEAYRQLADLVLRGLAAPAGSPARQRAAR
jgi:AcrR family transcriptional regulator